MVLGGTLNPRPVVLGIALLLGAASLPGCASPEPPRGPLRTVARFVEEDPQVILTRQRLFGASPVFEWQVPSSEDQLIWPPRGSRARVTLGGAEAAITWMRDRAIVVRRVTLDTSTVDAIEVVVENLTADNDRAGDVSLMWAAAGRSFRSSRRMVLTEGDATGKELRVYRFPVRSHPEWDGTVGKLRLAFAHYDRPGFDRLALRAVAGVSETLDLDELQRCVEDGVKVQLGGQLRNALPAFPGLTIEKRLRATPGSQLRLAYGIDPGVSCPVTLRIMAGVWPSSDRVLLERVVTPSDAEEGWREAVVGLEPLWGEEGLVVLEAEADPRCLSAGLAYWGHPEVVAP